MPNQAPATIQPKPPTEAPSTAPPRIMTACTPTNPTGTQSEGLEKARAALVSFFERLNDREYKEAAVLYGGEWDFENGIQ